MHRHRFAAPGALLAVAVIAASGCDRSEVPTGSSPEAEAGVLAAPQLSVEQARGVGPSAITHVFEALADGGRIEVQRSADDPGSVDAIRRHLEQVAETFASGDPGRQAFAHMREVPGAAIMAAAKDRIEYTYRDLPRGAEIRLVTDDPDALRAIHEFIAFHEEVHQSVGTHHGAMDHGPLQHGAMDHGAHGMMRDGGAGHGTHGRHAPGGDTP